MSTTLEPRSEKAADSSAKPLLRVRNLTKHFPVRKGVFRGIAGWVQAVDDISFDIYPGETLGLVGESGCGKTTAGRTLLRLIEPTSGHVEFAGYNVTDCNRSELRGLRRKMQIVFQDPYGSLNPRMTIRRIVEEGLIVNNLGNSKERREKVEAVLLRVGLEPSVMERYPHEFSGGQRQRICIARALVLDPKFIVLDEPISALDVSIQSQIINLLNELKREEDLTYLFISHDLSMVEYISDRVAVMYLGEIVEMAASDAIYHTPLHPYTRALLRSAPAATPQDKKPRIVLAGDVPSPLNPPSGCRFHPRCPLAFDRCKVESPLPVLIDDHFVRCHAAEESFARGGAYQDG